MGEQSNAYRILLRYDRKSRHRRIKKQRRYERLAATSQFVDSQRPLYSAVRHYQLNMCQQAISTDISASSLLNSYWAFNVWTKADQSSPCLPPHIDSCGLWLLDACDAHGRSKPSRYCLHNESGIAHAAATSFIAILVLCYVWQAERGVKRRVSVRVTA